MKYHLVIHDSYWPLCVDRWRHLTAFEQKQEMEERVTAFHRFLEAGGDPKQVCMVLANDSLLAVLPGLIECRTLDGTPYTGLDHIALERLDQKAKHGYDEAHDDTYTDEQLLQAAMAVITEDKDAWPKGWHIGSFLRATEKSTIGRLAVAGALIAAEIDRLMRAQRRASELPPAPKAPALPEKGSTVLVRDGYGPYLNPDDHGQALCDAYPALENTHRTVLSARRGTDHVAYILVDLDAAAMTSIELPGWLLQPVVKPETPTEQ